MTTKREMQTLDKLSTRELEMEQLRRRIARADDAIETFRMSIWKIELKQKRRWAELENQERLLSIEKVERKKAKSRK